MRAHVCLYYYNLLYQQSIDPNGEIATQGIEGEVQTPAVDIEGTGDAGGDVPLRRSQRICKPTIADDCMMYIQEFKSDVF